MPKIYEYLGIIIFFYSNDHAPIHVHAKRGDCESKAEFIIRDGKIIEIRIKSAGNAKPLKSVDMRNLRSFLRVYSEKIVEKWVDFFVLRKSVSFDRITKRLK